MERMRFWEAQVSGRKSLSHLTVPLKPPIVHFDQGMVIFYILFHRLIADKDRDGPHYHTISVVMAMSRNDDFCRMS